MDQQLKLDYSNCLKEFVGNEGISTEEIEALKSKLQTTHSEVLNKKSAGQLGFMELPYKVDEAKKIRQFAVKNKNRYDDFIVIGIGGSALGNTALQQSLRHTYWNLLNRKSRKNWLRLFVPDNVDPTLLSDLLESVNLKRTLINIISKSGTTAECLANFFVIKDKLIKKVGRKKYPDHVIITTDKEKGYLRELVKSGESIANFVVPPNVGGRFSVLSPVGLVSAAWTGINIMKLLAGAQEMDKKCSSNDVQKNPALMYSALQYLLYWKGKKTSVMMPYSNSLYGIADWFRQLWAESLGKKTNRKNETVNVGPTPIKSLGATDQHSQVQLYIEGPYDKIITFLSVEKFRNTVKIPKVDKLDNSADKSHYLGGHSLNELLKSEEQATRLALTQQGRPNCSIILPEINESSIGQLIYMLELATAYAGELFDINAFDQPGVELGKQLTYALLGRPGYEDKKKELLDHFNSYDKNKKVI